MKSHSRTTGQQRGTEQDDNEPENDDEHVGKNRLAREQGVQHYAQRMPSECPATPSAKERRPDTSQPFLRSRKLP